MFRLFKILGVVAVLVVAGFFAFRVLDSQFCLKNIRADIEHQNSVLSATIQLQLEKILNQQFNYLDRGKQSFVFASKDGRYVIKFFDMHCLKSENYFFFHSSEVCAKGILDLISGYRIAKEEISEHAGLIFVQLAPNDSLNFSINLTDRFGLKHEIDLSQVPFIIQKKAIPTRQVLTELLEKGDVKAAAADLRKIIDMYITEYHQGIYDRDHNFMYNTGFIDGFPIRIDVGKLRSDNRYKNPEYYRKDLQKVAIERVGDWFGRHFPQYQKEILSDMREKLQFMEERH